MSQLCLIETRSDLSCPFCYIARHNFLQALHTFSYKNDIDVQDKAFQIDPDFHRPHQSYSLLEHISKKYNQTPQQTKNMFASIESQAQKNGITIHFSKVIHVNTFSAHILIKHAQKFGKTHDIINQLFQVYFCDGKDISDTQTLKDIAKSCDISDVEQALTSEKYQTAIMSDMRQALDL